MEIFGFIFQLIVIHLIGNNIYYLMRKIVGDKHSYKEITTNEKNSGFRYFTGVIVILIVIVMMKKFIK